MNIILNERVYAENAIKNGYISDKPIGTLSILAKYYHSLGYSRIKITESLDKFMKKYFSNYNPDKWSNTIESQAIRAEKYPLKEIDFIPITEFELETIKGIKSDVLEKLAFTFLCLAKFYNMVNEHNKDWSNVEDRVVFKLANIQTNIVKQCLYINDIKTKGLIEYSKVVDNINTNVLYINNDSPVLLKITQFRDLGNEYLYCKGEDFIRCCDCGKLIRPNKKRNNFYCNECKGYQKQETKKIICVDCGKSFFIDGIVKNKKRCDTCQTIYNRQLKTIKQREYRNNT